MKLARQQASGTQASLLALLAWACAAHFVLHAAGASLWDSPCDCGCCLVTYRPPALQVNGVDQMCSVSEACPEQCQVQGRNTLTSSTDDGVLETSRFCLMDCLPRTREARDGCAPLSADQAGRLVTPSGNGADPATLGDAWPPPAELPETAAARGASAPASGDLAPSWAGADGARSAARLAAAARRASARGGAAEYAARETAAAAARARAYSEHARASLDKVREELTEIRAAPHEAAQAAAQEAAAMLRRDTERWRWEQAGAAQATAYRGVAQQPVAERLEADPRPPQQADQALPSLRRGAYAVVGGASHYGDAGAAAPAPAPALASGATFAADRAAWA